MPRYLVAHTLNQKLFHCLFLLFFRFILLSLLHTLYEVWRLNTKDETALIVATFFNSLLNEPVTVRKTVTVRDVATSTMWIQQPKHNETVSTKMRRPGKQHITTAYICLSAPRVSWRKTLHQRTVRWSLQFPLCRSILCRLSLPTSWPVLAAEPHICRTHLSRATDILHLWHRYSTKFLLQEGKHSKIEQTMIRIL